MAGNLSLPKLPKMSPPFPRQGKKFVTWNSLWGRLHVKQGVMTFAWRPGTEYNVAATRGADSVLANDCRAHFGRPSTGKGSRIGVTVRLPVRRRRETMCWQANANTPLSITPLLLGVSRWSLFLETLWGPLVPISAYLCLFVPSWSRYSSLLTAILRY